MIIVYLYIIKQPHVDRSEVKATGGLRPWLQFDHFHSLSYGNTIMDRRWKVKPSLVWRAIIQQQFRDLNKLTMRSDTHLFDKFDVFIHCQPANFRGRGKCWCTVSWGAQRPYFYSNPHLLLIWLINEGNEIVHSTGKWERSGSEKIPNTCQAGVIPQRKWEVVKNSEKVGITWQPLSSRVSWMHFRKRSHISVAEFNCEVCHIVCVCVLTTEMGHVSCCLFVVMWTL